MTSDEDRGLAVFDLIAVEVGGFRDHEDLVIIDVHLRHLPCVEGVLDGKRVQMKRLLKRTKFVGARIMEADPDKLVRRVGGPWIFKRDGFGSAAISVEECCNDAHERSFTHRVLHRWNGKTSLSSYLGCLVQLAWRSPRWSCEVTLKQLIPEAGAAAALRTP
ncbi:hypothetical protein EV291_14623 [Rhizobium sp. BK068]|nr:hypothetical protein EV291_14623 [Rhizobium sp. BK068]